MLGIHNKYRKSHYKMDYYYTELSMSSLKKKRIKRSLKKKVKREMLKDYD